METKLSLTTDGVEMVDYPTAMKTNVQLAAKAWQSFLQLPDTAKDTLTADQLQSGVGYERKGDGQRESNDIKENFDITTASLTELSLRASGIPEANTFIKASGNLFQDLRHMTVAYGEHVESTYGVEGFAAEAAASADSVFTRFLYYPQVPAGTVIGEPHVDHSGFTFHLYESTDGCERLSLDKLSWQPLPVMDGKAVAFPSMQTQLFSHNKLKGLCHKITANETTSKNGRIAIVCFVPLVNTPAYDRKTHGRLQEMEPGFNYNLPYERFKDLFVPPKNAKVSS